MAHFSVGDRHGHPTSPGTIGNRGRSGRGKMVNRGRGGRAPARRFQSGGIPGSTLCPTGTERTADGKCTQIAL